MPLRVERLERFLVPPMRRHVGEVGHQFPEAMELVAALDRVGCANSPAEQVDELVEVDSFHGPSVRQDCAWPRTPLSTSAAARRAASEAEAIRRSRRGGRTGRDTW